MTTETIPHLSDFDTAFARLTERWNRHQELRRSGVGIHELAESRRALDDARSALQRSSRVA
ncbi:MAG: hypothetical protein R2695_11495 [Acidimicrobiales bacterium]